MSEPKNIPLTQSMEVQTDLKEHKALDYVYNQVKHLNLVSIVLEDEEKGIYTVTYHANPMEENKSNTD